MDFQDWMALIRVAILAFGVLVAWVQLRKTASNTKMSALAEVSGAQRAISELMVKNDDLIPIVYPEYTKGNAKKDIFLTLLINNANLAYRQLELGLIGRKERRALARHLWGEFATCQPLKKRLQETQDVYNQRFVAYVIDP